MRASLINDQWLGSLLTQSTPPPHPSLFLFFSRLLHPVSFSACCYNCFHVPQLWCGPCWWGGEPSFWMRPTESSWVGFTGCAGIRPLSWESSCALMTQLWDLCVRSLWVRLSSARNVQFPLQSCHGNLLQPIRVTARSALEGSEVNVAKQPL